MLRMYVLKIITICIFLMPQLVNAQWSGKQQIEELYVHFDAVVVKLTVNPAADCGDNTYLTLEQGGSPASPLFKEMYSMLLAAKMAKQNVDVYIDGCGTSQTMHARIRYVRVN